MKVERWNGASPPRADDLVAALARDGYGSYVWSDAPGTSYPPHTHGDDQSHWIVDGSLALTVGGEEYVLGPGDRDWLPAGTVHAARVVGPTEVTYVIGSRPRASR